MSKQVTLSLKFCMETGLPTGSIMKYNFFVNPLLLVKPTLSFAIMKGTKVLTLGAGREVLPHNMAVTKM